MITADMAFFTRVADPLVGEMNMTLMNISYIGGKLFKNFSMSLIDIITWKSCVFENYSNSTVLMIIDNKRENEKTKCINSGAYCRIDIGGYYIEVAFNVFFGIVWFQWAKQIIKYLVKSKVIRKYQPRNDTPKSIIKFVLN